MSRVILEATGRRHWETTCSVLPQRLPRQQQTKQQQQQHAPPLLAILMAMAVHRYNTTRIAQWRRSRALLEATGRRHRASIMSDNKGADIARTFFLCFHRQNRRKRSQVDAKNPVFNRGMTYQTKEKGLTKVTI